MSFDRHSVPLPLALHLATYTVIGLFTAFAGGLNLLDPGHILGYGVPLLAVSGLSFGYVFGILMGRKEVVALGFAVSAAYVALGIWAWSRGVLGLGADWRLALLFLGIGGYGLVALGMYRKTIPV